MNPSFSAFADELLLIKAAESDEPIMTPELASAAPVMDEELQSHRSDLPILAKQRFKSALKYGLGHGLGYGTGYVLGDVVMPRVLPKAWSEGARRNVGFAIGGLGAIGSLALWDALRQAGKDEDDALKRHR